ncbi:hypothetical protein [Haloarcula amylovorans]|uniref:hypothetical protein n=1 Tax=Haloarcula amylovorans TaxID=2562280 RepID=UPI001ADDC96E|nr:hypothetical protein [Halomicroarcula amylolytica]
MNSSLTHDQEDARSISDKVAILNYTHIDEMRELENENETALNRVRESLLKPKETGQ